MPVPFLSHIKSKKITIHIRTYRLQPLRSKPLGLYIPTIPRQTKTVYQISPVTTF